MSRNDTVAALFVFLCFSCSLSALAQDAKQAQKADASSKGEAAQTEAEPDPVVLAAIKGLNPLFDQIKNAQTTRSTVELSTDTIVDGAIINSEATTYQIASKAPEEFTIYLRDAQRRVRVFNNPKQPTIALSPTAYTRLEEPIAMQDAVFGLPVPMGPYPEAVLSLTLAGVDPNYTFTAGMKTLQLADRNPFRGKTPAIHFTGVQDDDVQWDLWITQDKPNPSHCVCLST